MITTMEHDWRDVLLKAASIVEEGWCQGALHLQQGWGSPDPRYPCHSRKDAEQSCATGAIGRAFVQLKPGVTLQCPGGVVDRRAPCVSTWKPEEAPDLVVQIAAWNDHPWPDRQPKWPRLCARRRHEH